MNVLVMNGESIQLVNGILIPALWYFICLRCSVWLSVIVIRLSHQRESTGLSTTELPVESYVSQASQRLASHQGASDHGYSLERYTGPF